MTPPAAIFASASIIGLLVSSWHAGYAVEWFLKSRYCWPLAKRAAYMLLALWFETAIFFTVWRWLA